jgi:thiol-disulfide isomerase/thioredoxin
MKKVLENASLLVLLSISFSALTGCGSTTAVNDAVPTGNKPAAAAKSSEYPPLASALAEADFEMLDGTKFKISDHKGKVLMLNLWGTWCGPCRAEMPHLVEMKEKHGPQGFEVIGLNIGDGSGTPEPNELIEPFVEKMKLNYMIARSPNSSTVEFYKVTKQQVVPQSLLIDRDGHLRGMFIGGGPRVFDSMKQTLDKTMADQPAL